MKFKVGQTVQFTKDCSNYDFGDMGAKNTIGIITSIKGKFMRIDIINNDQCFIKGEIYSFLSDVWDSIKVIKDVENVKKSWWRFWK